MDPKRILVVDDDSEILDLIRVTLQRDGWTIFESQGSEAAWNLWHELTLKPHVALLDMNISNRSDGIALARRLRAADPCLQIVIISGFFDDAERYPGEFYYVDKPFQLSELVVVCNTMFRYQKAECQTRNC